MPMLPKKKLVLNSVHLDADETSIFERTLASVEATTHEVMFPARTILGILELDTSDSPGAQTYISRIYESIGMAEFVDDYAKGQSPRVDIVGSELIGKFHSLTASVHFDTQELRGAALAGIPLDTMKFVTVQMVHSQRWNELVWFGDEDRGILGILTHPNITKSHASTVDGHTEWEYSGGVKPPKDINSDLSYPGRAVQSLTKKIETIDTILLPVERMGYIEDTYISEAGVSLTGKTILESFRSRHPSVMVDSVPELDNVPFDPYNGDPVEGGINCLVAFSSLARCGRIKGPVPYEMAQPDISGFSIDIETRSRIGGFVTNYPLAWHIMSGI